MTTRDKDLQYLNQIKENLCHDSPNRQKLYQAYDLVFSPQGCPKDNLLSKRLVGGGSRQHRDCNTYPYIKSKWLALKFVMPRSNGHIARLNDRNQIELVDEPMPLDQSFGVKFQRVVPYYLYNYALKYITDRCEQRYNQPNPQLIDDFVNDYHIDPERFEDLDYKTLNEYFIRRYKKEFYQCPRNVYPLDNRIIRSPVTSYTTIYRNETLVKKYWIKDQTYTVSEMIDHEITGQHLLIINRLALGHYHRFHAPVSGRLVGVRYISGNYMSGNSALVRAGRPVYTRNKRVVLAIETEVFGLIYIVLVGSVCVGSIVFVNQLKPLNQTQTPTPIPLTQGQELGYFQYGGSTVITVVPSENQSLLIQPVIEHLSTRKKAIEFEVEVLDPLLLIR